MSRHVKPAAVIAKEAGYPDKDTTYAAAFGVLSAVIETFLMFADDCDDSEQLKDYVKRGFEKVVE